MTQRIFDIDNEKDMADLWDILPDDVVMVVKDESHGWTKNYCKFKRNDYSDKTAGTLFKIDWHDKTEITRPIQEATEADIGKFCYFWDYSDEDYSRRIGLLTRIYDDKEYKYTMSDGESFNHCRRLTKQEIEELL